jgi:hypothetical protein
LQQRQLPPSALDNLAAVEQSALRRARARRLQWLTTGAGAAVLALFAVGCPQPGDLDNPNDYPAPTGMAGMATAGSAGTSSGSPCETACMNAIIDGCVACHNAQLPSGDLVMAKMGYTANLKDQPAKHKDAGASAVCPTGDKLIDTANADNSWFLKKLMNTQGNCGTVMPLTGMLSGDALTCAQTYVACVAGGPVGGGTGGQASGGGGAASGGAASGGGGAATGGNGGTGGT